MSDKVVPIFRQSGSNCPTEFGHLGNWNHFKLKQGGPNSLNEWSQFSDCSNSLTYSKTFSCVHKIFQSETKITQDVLVHRRNLYYIKISKWETLSLLRCADSSTTTKKIKIFVQKPPALLIPIAEGGDKHTNKQTNRLTLRLID